MARKITVDNISLITDYRREWGPPALRDRLGYDLVRKCGLRWSAFLNTILSNIQLVLNTRIRGGKVKIDLHGYHPSEIVFNGTLGKIVQQTWEMGENELTLIHGHGRNRGITPGFVNTNTGYFGLCIRQAMRHDQSLRRWIKYTTLDCREMGSTTIRLKANPNPTRKQFDIPGM
jgi:hypothetical protein